MTYTIVPMTESPTGKWTHDLSIHCRPTCTPDDWPYSGGLTNNHFIILKTRTTKTKRFLYLVKDTDPRLASIYIYKISVQWADGRTFFFFTPPQKYKLDKKCFTRRGEYFIMGKILEKMTIPEFLALNLRTFSSGPISCSI